MSRRAPVVAAYGMGTNSTALLIEMVERGEPVDLIIASDTGGERPETYAYAAMFSNWLSAHGYPPVTMTRKGGRQETLEENCFRMAMLPSIAYGYKGCSRKFKREPQDRDVNRWQPARDAWAAGVKVVKLLGYDADEPHRAQRAAAVDDPKYRYRYPLIEWGWGRDECVERIARAGLSQPGKSACFFCPSSTREEIETLKREHPVLFHRALLMEVVAEPNLATVAGLGRRFSWHSFGDDRGAEDFARRADSRYAAGRTAAKEKRESGIEVDCGCYDEAKG